MSDTLLTRTYTGRFADFDIDFGSDEDGYDVAVGPDDLVNRAECGAVNDDWHQIEEEPRDSAWEEYIPANQQWNDDQDWIEYLGLPWFASREAIVAAWIEYAYSAFINKNKEHAVENEDLYEQLPIAEARRHVMMQKVGWLDRFERREMRRHHPGRRVHTANGMSEHRKGWRSSDSQGRHGRCQVKARDEHGNPINIRTARATSHRQMDNIWLQEMNDLSQCWTTEDWLEHYARSKIIHGVMVASESSEYYLRLLETCGVDGSFADQHWGGYPSLDEHNREVFAEDMDWCDDMRWHWGQYDFEMTESTQNCHGFNGDPWNEHLLDRWYDPYVYDSSGYEFDSDDVWYGYNDPDEDDFNDRYEWGILTLGEIEMLDDEERARDEEEETLELWFEHIPASNAMGRKACLAAAAARI